MKFIHNDLGYRNGGEVVVVTLSAAANVLLMDSSNFQNYRSSGKQKQLVVADIHVRHYRD